MMFQLCLKLYIVQEKELTLAGRAPTTAFSYSPTIDLNKGYTLYLYPLSLSISITCIFTFKATLQFYIPILKWVMVLVIWQQEQIQMLCKCLFLTSTPNTTSSEVPEKEIDKVINKWQKNSWGEENEQIYFMDMVKTENYGCVSYSSC